MITRIHDPLLCLTVSITLREKPLALTGARRIIADLADSAGGLAEIAPSSTAVSVVGDMNGEADSIEGDDDGIILNGLTEVNLFEGLTTGKYISCIVYPVIIKLDTRPFVRFKDGKAQSSFHSIGPHHTPTVFLAGSSRIYSCR